MAPAMSARASSWTRVFAPVAVSTAYSAEVLRPRESRKRWLGARAETDQTPAAIATPAPIGASRAFDTSAAWRQCLQQMRFDTVAVLKSIPFLVLLAFGVLNFIGGARTLDSLFGTNVYPVTSLMLEAMQASSDCAPAFSAFASTQT